MPPSDAKKSGEKKLDSRKIADVAKPGKTPPDASARPIIVTHRPMVLDPMVSEAKEPLEKPVEAAAASPEPVNHAGKIIKPIEDSIPDKDKTETNDAEDEKIASSEKPEKEVEAQTTTETENPETSEINAAAEETADKKAEKEAGDKEDKEKKERSEKVEKLVEEKKYFVKVGEVGRKRRSRSLVIFLLLLLILAGAYLVIDAEVIKLNIDLPIDLIK